MPEQFTDPVGHTFRLRSFAVYVYIDDLDGGVQIFNILWMEFDHRGIAAVPDFGDTHEPIDLIIKVKRLDEINRRMAKMGVRLL